MQALEEYYEPLALPTLDPDWGCPPQDMKEWVPMGLGFRVGNYSGRGGSRQTSPAGTVELKFNRRRVSGAQNLV